MTSTVSNFLIHITIGGKEIQGGSKIPGYTNWFDGSGDPIQSMYISNRSIDYGFTSIVIPINKGSWGMFDEIMAQSYGQIDIKIAQLSSNASKVNYASMIREYADCEISALTQVDGEFHILFKARKSVGLTAEVANEGVKGTEKFGPSVYNLETNKPQ